MTTSPAQRARYAAVRYAPRSRDAGAYLREWVVSRYPGFRAQEHLAASLSVPTYRPEFVDGNTYDGVMAPFLEQVVQEATYRARRIPASHLSTGTRPVLMAVRDLLAPRTEGKR